jgi:hypothetical protein
MIQHSRRKRETTSREQAVAILSAYRQSGLTQVRFCQDRQIPVWRLHRWLHLERRGKLSAPSGESSSPPELIRVSLPENDSARAADWAYELDWRHGQLRWGANFQVRQLRQLLRLLRVC